MEGLSSEKNEVDKEKLNEIHESSESASQTKYYFVWIKQIKNVEHILQSKIKPYWNKKEIKNFLNIFIAGELQGSR